MTDIEIARSVQLEKIADVAKKFGIEEENLEFYGKYKAKISKEFIDSVQDRKDGKLILVTAINPTPLGEGKTTVAIGLGDALNKIGRKTVLALREPSLGPVFGIKGGATGGGYAQVAPMEDINLHFTGDIHAITSANNLLSAIIDNHIYFGNELQIQEVLFQRCLDLNDRALRNVTLKNRKDHFDIDFAHQHSCDKIYQHLTNSIHLLHKLFHFLNSTLAYQNLNRLRSPNLSMRKQVFSLCLFHCHFHTSKYLFFS